MLSNPQAAARHVTPHAAMPSPLLDRAMGLAHLEGRSALHSEGIPPAHLDPRQGFGGVQISRLEGVFRSPLRWQDAMAEIVHVATGKRIDIAFRAPVHLLVLHDKGSRGDGDTTLEGAGTSPLKDFGQRLTFVPAGHDYRESIERRSPIRIVYFYFDPSRLASTGTPGEAPHSRLFFEDHALAVSMRKLRTALEQPHLSDRGYLSALGMMVIHEVARIGRQPGRDIHHGGLAPWQQRAVQAYVEEHLDRSIRLTTLAALARLSPYHFCRAFKQTFGVSPMRYHTRRRIERAKDLLVAQKESVTEIGMLVGYSETSSFTGAFRKLTGVTPSLYRRNLG